MKASLLIALFASLLQTTPAFAMSKCATTARTPEREKMVKSYREKDYEAFASFYETYCKKNSAKISCRTEKADGGSAKEKMTMAAKGHPCAEAFSVSSNDSKSAMLYIIDAK